jgi:hypothetical protein
MIIRQYPVILYIGNETRGLVVPKIGIGGLPLGFVMIFFEGFLGKIIGKNQRAVRTFEEGARIAIKKRGGEFTGYYWFSAWRWAILRFICA